MRFVASHSLSILQGCLQWNQSYSIANFMNIYSFLLFLSQPLSNFIWLRKNTSINTDCFRKILKQQSTLCFNEWVYMQLSRFYGFSYSNEISRNSVFRGFSAQFCLSFFTLNKIKMVGSKSSPICSLAVSIYFLGFCLMSALRLCLRKFQRLSLSQDLFHLNVSASLFLFPKRCHFYVCFSCSSTKVAAF